jgi:hypothetical protein
LSYVEPSKQLALIKVSIKVCRSRRALDAPIAIEIEACTNLDILEVVGRAVRGIHVCISVVDAGL